MDDFEKIAMTALIALGAVSIASRVPPLAKFVFNLQSAKA